MSETEQEINQKLDQILSGYRTPQGDTDYLKEVANMVHSEIGVKYLSEMQAEFNQANVLAYRQEAEVWEAKHLIRFRTNEFLSEHPPEGSKMTGSFRRLVYGNDNEALSQAEVREILALEQVLIARVTQSRNMEQQRIIKEMRQEQSLTREDTTGSGSWKDRVRSALS
jgi:hypothetical protein